MIAKRAPGVISKLTRFAAGGGALSLSAVLMAVARDHAGLAWFGWIGLIPLLIIVTRTTPARGLGAGLLWGVVFAATVLARTTIDGGLVTIALLGVVTGVYALSAAALTRRLGPSPYLLALGWIGVELALRPLGWQQGLLAATQADGGIATSVAGTLGYGFVAFVVVYVNALLIEVVKISDRNAPRGVWVGEACSLRPRMPGRQRLVHAVAWAHGPRAPPRA